MAKLFVTTEEDLAKMKIAVLMGGNSSEREISLKTGSAIEKALRSQGFQVAAIDADSQLATKLHAEDIDLVFLALHGKYGEDGSVQGLLEIMGIPYTGSSVLASALAFHKAKTKAVLNFHHIPTPRFTVLTKGDFLSDPAKARDLVWQYPIVIKPCEEGSTFGISIVRSPDGLEAACNHAFRYGEEALIEEFIDGREVTVGILGDQALPVVEVIPISGFYDYESKYTVGKTEYVVPARLDENLYQQVQYWGLRAHGALGCKGVSRVDIRIDQKGNPFVLEINTIPGMTETSLLPKAAKVAGISFEELVKRILILALPSSPSYSKENISPLLLKGAGTVSP
ncbi:MAG: D-alanine--D-alanine ligase [bacterium]